MLIFSFMLLLSISKENIFFFYQGPKTWMQIRNGCISTSHQIYRISFSPPTKKKNNFLWQILSAETNFGIYINDFQKQFPAYSFLIPWLWPYIVLRQIKLMCWLWPYTVLSQIKLVGFDNGIVKGLRLIVRSQIPF